MRKSPVISSSTSTRWSPAAKANASRTRSVSAWLRSPDKGGQPMELAGRNYTRNDWRSFLATRRGTVLVALACGIVAAGILIFAMARYRHSVNAEGKQETVLVASGVIQKGTSGTAIASEQLFKPSSILAKQVSAGAILD